jgi:hypothetical protein
MADKLVYLATPYTGFKGSREEAFNLACIAAADLMDKGYKVFSPIAHSHSIEVEAAWTPRTGDWWLEQDFAILKHCEALFVYLLPGWDTSYGVAKEIEFAKIHNIPITYLEYKEQWYQHAFEF